MERVDRVGQQIDHDLLELDRVPRDRGQVGVELPTNRDLVDAEAVGHQIEGAPHHVVEVDVGDLTLGGAHEAQQATQQLGRPAHLAQNLCHLTALLGVDRGIGEPVFRVRGDRHQRVVHLVRHAGEKLAGGREAALLLRPIPQDTGHRVEVLGQPPELVGPAHRDPHGEVAVGDLGEAGLELAQRTPHTPAHHVRQRGDEQHADDQPDDRVAPRHVHRFPQLPLAGYHVRARDSRRGVLGVVRDAHQLFDRDQRFGGVRDPSSLERLNELGQGAREPRQRVVGPRERGPQRQREERPGGDRKRRPPEIQPAARRRDGIGLRPGAPGQSPRHHQGLIEHAVPPREILSHAGDRLRERAEHQHGATDAEEHVHGQGGGVRARRYRDREQRHAQARSVRSHASTVATASG